MTERLDDDAVLQRSSAALSRRLLDGVVVLAPGMSEPVRVTTPGEVLWAMLVEACTITDLIEVWATLFGVPDHTARAEIEPLLCLLLDGGALRLTEGFG